MATANRSKLYEKIKFLGEGQFATVYQAKSLVNDEIVAVKKIKLGTQEEAADGINRTAVREIKLLQELQHKHIIGLLDVFGQRSNISLVFDFMDTDLEVIIKDQAIFLTPGNVKSYALQTLLGLEYLHRNWILHRDIKPNNLLINHSGILKIGDFGLARFYGSPTRQYTHRVVTRWYRSPELLFGARSYGTGVDIWAVGCVVAELLLRVPFLPGDSDMDQLSKIFSALGTPTTEEWPELTALSDYIQFRPELGTPLRDIFTAAGDDQLELIANLFKFNPLSRWTATQALQSSYFSNHPAPSSGSELPMPHSVKEVGKASQLNMDKKPRKRKLLEEGGEIKKQLQFD